MKFEKGHTPWNKGKKFSAEACKKMSLAKKKSLCQINNNLGHEMWRQKVGYIVKVCKKDYPNCTDYNYNKHLKCTNKDFIYIRRSLKNWIDAGNEIPPKGSVLYHLDGNLRNDDVKNLCVVSRAVMAIMSTKNRHTNFCRVNTSNILLSSLESKIMEGITKEEKRMIANERAKKWYQEHKHEIANRRFKYRLELKFKNEKTNKK